ncbi:MAG: PEP-CTERM sorting domain-containing protein [Burkholderiales bacterium]
MHHRIPPGAAIAGLLMLITLPGRAAVIDFAGLSAPGNDFAFLGTTVAQGGFVFESTPSLYGGELGVWQDDSPNHPAGGVAGTSLVEYYAYAVTTMTPADGQPFRLDAIDLAPWRAGQYGSFDVTFVGTKRDGSTVAQTVTVRNANGAVPVLQHFPFSGFIDLASVAFVQGESPSSYTAYQFNRVDVSRAPVPEPGTVWLFSLGIVGGVASRLRRRFGRASR